MQIQHIVVTRFCLRYWHRSRPFDGMKLQREFEPMAADNLRLRTLTISAITYPSIASQTYQNFDWVIMVEPDLDQAWLEKLTEFASRHKNIHIHPLDDDTELGFNFWLKPYIREDTRYLATTLLDDDDALCPGYMQVLHDSIEQDLEAGAYPLRLYGTLRAIQWDMDFRESSVYGRFAPEWHRRNHAAVACGLTLVARYPEVRISASAIRHGHLDAYFTPIHETHGNEPNVLWVQQQLKADLHSMGLDPAVLFDVQLKRLDELVDPMLLTNHGRNLQQNRIDEIKTGSRTVVPGQSFGSCEVNWALIKSHSALFEGQARVSMIRKMVRRLRHFYRTVSGRLV